MRTMVFGDYFIEEGEFGLESEGKMELTQVERSDSNPGRWTKERRLDKFLE